jgi:hypothetical protein
MRLDDATQAFFALLESDPNKEDGSSVVAKASASESIFAATRYSEQVCQRPVRLL